MAIALAVAGGIVLAALILGSLAAFVASVRAHLREWLQLLVCVVWFAVVVIAWADGWSTEPGTVLPILLWGPALVWVIEKL